MSKATKIIATISDKRCDVDFLRQLYNEGMNVVRLNSAHLDLEGFLRIINNTREVSNQIAILMDTKGPEIRTTIVQGNGIVIKTGDKSKFQAIQIKYLPTSIFMLTIRFLFVT